MDDILAATSLLVAPPPLPQVDVISEDEEDEEDIDPEEQEDEDNDEDSYVYIEENDVYRYMQTMVWQMAHGTTPATPCRNIFTLEFEDPRLETAFATENNNRMVHRDVFGYLVSLCVMASLLFAPQTKFSLPGATAHNESMQMWRWIVCYLPACFLFSKNMRPFYCRHREALLAFTYLTSASWALHVHHFLQLLEEASISRLIYMHGFIWLFLLILYFQMRFRLLLPLTFACFALDLAMLPKICRAFYPHSYSPLSCIGAQMMKFGVISLIGPLLFVWWAEKRSREAFVMRMQAHS